MSLDNTATPARRAFTCRILWFAMMMATLIYALLAYFLQHQGIRSQTRALPPALGSNGSLIAVGVGAVGLALAWVIATAMGPRPLSGPVGSGPTENGAPAGAWPKIQSATMAAGAIAEGVGIVGLLLFFLGLPLSTFLLFIALSLVIHAVNFVRLQGWIAAAQSGGAPS
jgi:hypothetical protein